jgi:extradiol dioxygenase family protein
MDGSPHDRTALIAVLAAVLFGIPDAARAQLAPPNAKGVTMGHLHYSTHDVDAQRRFWVALGGTSTPNLDLDLVGFPGVYVVTWQRDQIQDQSESTTPVVTFKVKNLSESIAKWKAAGITVEPGTVTVAAQAFAIAPDRTRVEILEDRSIPVPIQMYRVHVVTPSPADAQAWYAKVFGGVPGKVGDLPSLQFPGAVMTFGQAKGAVAPTRGHVLDHWGFEIQHLEQFTKNLEASGIPLDRPYRVRRPGEARTALSYVIDPWGTAIEMTEYLAPDTR